MWTLFKSSSNWLQCCSVSCVWSPLAAGSWDPSSPMGVNLQPLTGGAVLTTGPPGKSLNSSSRKTLGPGSASNSRGDGLCCLRPRLVPQSVLDAPQCTLQEALPFAVLQALSGRWAAQMAARPSWSSLPARWWVLTSQLAGEAPSLSPWLPGSQLLLFSTKLCLTLLRPHGL